MNNIEDIYNLSPMQQGMLFHTLEAPTSGMYCEQTSWSLTGFLDLSAFKQAWQQAVHRHTSLRTAFYWEELDAPLQVVYRQIELPWIQEDWREIPPAEQAERLEAFLAADRAYGFELGQAPLMRCALLRIAEAKYYFVWSYHHLLLDGWSLPRVLGEISACYAAYSRGQAPQLSYARPYRDYIAWLQRQDLEQAERFWRETLQGFTAPTPLPIGRSETGRRPDATAYEEQTLRLSAALTGRLQALARAHRLTFNTLVQGVWALLLARYSGEADVLFGTTVSGRPAELPGVENMVGLFINTLPVRVRVPAEADVLPWLAQLQAQQAERDQYAYSPLVDIQGWSEVPRGLPLFESLVVFENYPIEAALAEQAHEIHTREVRTVERTNYPLTLVAALVGSELSLKVVHDAERFEAATITRLLTHAETALGGMAANPAQRLSELPLVPEAEARQLLVDWNATDTEYPKDRCIHQLFEAQADKTPDAVAVVFEDQVLTYRALDARANQLAHHLRALGVGPESRIGLCLERSPEMLVALLAVLKAGAAYVPLDPAYPRERLAFMLEDAAVSVLLTQARLRESLPETSVPVLCLDQAWATMAQRPDSAPVSGVGPENLAYIIYTSGSTGKPKGVMIVHQGLINYLSWCTEAYAVADGNGTPVQSSIGFDATITSIFPALLVGRPVILLPEKQEIEGLSALLQAQRDLSLVKITPAHLDALGPLLSPEALSGQARALILGGEALTMKSLAVWRTYAPETRLINEYGPTETVVGCCVYEVPPEASSSGAVPIGRPIANTQLYVLDERFRPVPIGVPGELHIGGDGVARGYLYRPDLTAERFIPHPFSRNPGARLYRTGDLARRRADGELEFLGRIDHQVKLRGFRIELGEIEAALSQQPGIHDAVVLLREDAPGEKRLVAYTVGAVDPETLRAALKSQLPDYMVPTAWVTLDALPLTPNGKVDRKALPAPERDGAGAAYVPPQTPTEELLAGIWAELFGHERVGRHDDFFALGGHSLRAIQVVSRVRETLGLELPVRRLFEHPTLADLAAALDATRDTPTAALPPLTPVSRHQPLRLAFAQERLWFLDQLEGPSATYTIPGGLELHGPLDVAALRRSLAEIVRRHESLRTTFPTVDGVAVQHIAPPGPVPLSLIDLTALPDAGRAAAFERRIADETRRPFDLAHGPLLRASLVRLAPDRHGLLLNLHHIVSDGWSMAVLVRELSSLYAAYALNQPAALPPLPIQYADYAQWQRTWLAGEVLDRQLRYWQQQLAGAPTRLELPTDHPRPPVQRFHGATRTLALDPALTQALRALSRRLGATLFMTLLSAFLTLLARYSRQDDLVVGTPVANRNRRETEGLIGFFVNTLVLRVDLAGNPAFEEVVARVRQRALDAYAHQEVPFERIVEAVQPERSLSHSPLFQVMFVLQNTPAATLTLPGLTLSPLPLHGVAAKFDLTLVLSDSEAGLHGVWEYSTDLFEAETIDRLGRHFDCLLRGIVADPTQRLSALPLLPDAEAHQLLVDWNATDTEYPKDRCLHQLFEARAEETPDAVAVVFEDQVLTYRDLDTRANQLAHHLRALGVGPDSRVALCVERSCEMVIGLLAVLKAGGAYVPLDPGYPEERLAYMLTDAAPRVLLTHGGLASRSLATAPAVPVIDLGDPTPWAHQPTHNPDPSAVGLTAENLAYVIYTSGSTGTPKGTLLPHRGLCNVADAQRHRFGVGSGDRVLQFASFSFDASTFEIVMALGAGATLCLGQREDLLPGPSLIRLLREKAVSLVTLPPSALALLPHEGLPALRVVTVAGEACSPELAARWGRNRRFFNLYGPTEATIWTTIGTYRERDDTLSIGRPIANTEIYILDAQRRPVPIGVPGELCIGGVGLARGYLHRPDLTAERFIPHPFSRVPGARLYRTGDLARRRADGTLEFLGRIDHQVKLRGFRIELGEIEAALSQQPGVRDAVVLLREDAPGEKRLVAYTVGAVDPETLRTALKAQLPDYMVPTAWVTLDALPLTPNGKVDRKALPAPERDGASAAYVPPQTPTEELLAGIWAELFGHERVGRHDDFFALGGHSLRAIQVVSRVRETLGLELPVRHLFEHPTLADLAAALDATRHTPTTALPPLTPVSRHQPLRLAFAQERLWFLDQLEGPSATYTIPGGLELHGPLEVAALRRSLAEIVRRHESLRTTFPTVDGVAVQHIAPPGPVPLSLIDLTALPDAGRAAAFERRIADETRRPFDLAHGPLLRASLVRLAPDRHGLLLNLHHIVSDGWSMAVLVRELSSLYAAYALNQPAALPPLPIQYADYAQWQRTWLAGEVLDRQLRYWQQQLAGAPTRLELPTDHPRPPVQRFHGATRTLALDPALTQALRALSRRLGATLFMTLLSAFLTLLARYSRQDDLVVGTPVANRNRRETEGLIGFFVNTLVLRVDLAGNPAFEEVVARVRQRALDAYAHQEVPFERIVEAVQPERSLSHSPLFQVMFVLQNTPAATLTLPGLTLSPLPLHGVAAKFDLTLVLSDSEAGLHGVWEYSTDLFEAETIDRLGRHFDCLLRGIVADPTQRLSALPLLPDAEAHQLLVDWNATDTEYPKDRCLHQLFEARAEETPDAVAVVFEDQVLTYRDLDTRANQLAHHLRALGVGPDSRVALCVERSCEMVIGLLAVLKAGGAYVPLDPGYPEERLAYMLTDAAPRVLLTHGGLASRSLATAPAVPVIDLGDPTPWAHQPTHNPDPSAVGLTAENLAYVIYTSGSTGTPKGAMISHRSICNHMLWMQDAFPLTESDKVLQKTPFGFDASVWEFYAPLLSGAQLILARPGGHQDALYLIDVLGERQVTTLQLVPSMLQILLEVGGLERCHALRRLFCGGEALPLALQERFRACHGAELHNLYGPTEATIDVGAWRCEPGSSLPIAPIGRPIANTRFYLLDEQLRPAPIGVPGELHIGGDGVARGYLHRPELTAERFIPHPFSRVPGARLYRTGDLARRRADGTLEFLGRIDHQVKLRGFRIELGEIEATLSQQPGIRDAVVLLREDAPGEKRLVAYCVGAVDPETLRAALKAQLPDYMVPTAWVTLDALPLTPNGKLDRKALPAPDASLGVPAEGFMAPRDTLELELAQIWENVLDIRPIGVKDNFFEIGGHSLIAVRLMAQIQHAFGKNLPLATLFQAPTIEQLAEILRSRTGALRWSPLVAIQPKGSSKAFFCVPGAGGTVLYLHPLARHLGLDQPFYGLQARGLDGESAPHTRVEDMAAEYIDALQSVQPEGPYFLGGHSFGAWVAFEMARQLLIQGHDVARLVVLDTYAPLPPAAVDTPVTPPDNAWLIANVATILERLFGKKLGVTSDALRPLAPDEQLDDLRDRLQKAQVLPPGAGTEQVRGLVRVFKASSQVNYFPQKPLPTRITLFLASEDEPEQALAGDRPSEIPQREGAWGWDRFSEQPVEVQVVPGNHLSMMSEPHVQALADQLKPCFSRVSDLRSNCDTRNTTNSGTEEN
ncbi:linear gramicidin synthase subunit C [Methylocaldum marinum]|uniref:Linear gramicidin synthase subunit C n=2 Tax=Methylocaldum marinum TaxID=1432792 RepID=A0A250KNB1_9GAMM|nr:linear gramicidin synthase subunit C [Methylocaldum marinum]